MIIYLMMQNRNLFLYQIKVCLKRSNLLLIKLQALKVFIQLIRLKEQKTGQKLKSLVKKMPINTKMNLSGLKKVLNQKIWLH